MYRIRLLKEGQIVEIVDDIIDIAEIAHQATELEAQHGAEDWEIVNGHQATGSDENALEKRHGRASAA